MEANFKALEKNLMDIIAEQQLKLGYRKEPVRLYYPVSSLRNLLYAHGEKKADTDSDEKEAEYRKLKNIITAYFNDEGAASPLNGLEISNKGERFCLTVSPEGSEYVHNRLISEDIPEVKFLRSFLECVSHHNISLEDILAVFKSCSDAVKCESTDIPDFDYLIYFADGFPDEYMYCIKFEGEHAIYHRFTKLDYVDFNF
jgi:hypothetical protein